MTNASKRHANNWASTASAPGSTSPAPTARRGVAERLPAEAYINVQGDEPFISATAIGDDVSEALEYTLPGTFAVNACTELVDVGAVLDHNVVKVVVTARSEALMFSRQPIPYPKGDRPRVPAPAGHSTASLAGLSNASASSSRGLGACRGSGDAALRRTRPRRTDGPCSGQRRGGRHPGGSGASRAPT
ncbi:cytidylyltransferase domain-containing protein [Streptomyces sp. KL116D]|uniref:cytidylyltransferase domain-containing protein n=1 Tax=Streptomyces sp. KL116D TaxID=3045152 RepID=UPI003555D16A